MGKKSKKPKPYCACDIEWDDVLTVRGETVRAVVGVDRINCPIHSPENQP